MIISFKHKGLEKFYKTGSTAGIVVAHKKKLQILLTHLENTKVINDMNIIGFDLHKLSGNLKDHWSVKVNGNWRITFKIESGHIHVVDYQDYH